MCTCYSSPAIKQINYIYIYTGLIGLALALALAAALDVSKMSNSGYSLKARAESHLPKSRQRFKLCMRWKTHTHTHTLATKILTNANANFLASRWKEEGSEVGRGGWGVKAETLAKFKSQQIRFGISFCRAFTLACSRFVVGRKIGHEAKWIYFVILHLCVSWAVCRVRGLA